MVAIKTMIFILGATLLSCAEGKFNATKKVHTPPATQSLNTDQVGSDNANPDDTSGKTICSGLNEKECKDKKKSENNENSVRVIDCSTKAGDECEQAVAKEVENDGDNKSAIIVKGCVDSKEAKCSHIRDNYGKDINIKVLSEQEGESVNSGEGGESDTKSKNPDGSIEEGSGTDKPGQGEITEGNSDSTKLNSGYICLGGIGGRITNARKTEAEAKSCLSSANSKPCLNDSKCGSEYKLQIHKCKCSNPEGIDYTRTCARHNPLKPGHPGDLPYCELIK